MPNARFPTNFLPGPAPRIGWQDANKVRRPWCSIKDLYKEMEQRRKRVQ
jgi:hypothetical protein